MMQERTPPGPAGTVPSVWLVSRDLELHAALDWAVSDAGWVFRAFEYMQDAVDQSAQDVPDVLVLETPALKAGAGALCRLAFSSRALASVPRIILSGSNDPRMRYNCLSCGTAGFFQKPVNALALVRRIAFVLESPRRWQRRRLPGPITFGPLVVDLEGGTVRTGSRQSRLTPSQTLILEYLLERSGEVVSADDLLADALGYPAREGESGLIRHQVWNLRQKIEPDPANPRFLSATAGEGYILHVVPDLRRAGPAPGSEAIGQAIGPDEDDNGDLPAMPRCPCNPTPVRIARTRTGLDTIDHQHRTLIARVDHLAVALAEGREASELECLVAFLEHYAARHFAAEEGLMVAHDYSKLDRHRDLHGQFTRDLLAAKREMLRGGPSTAVAKGMAGKLADWIEKHIAREDMHFAESIRT